jgi:hypothetical protein
MSFSFRTAPTPRFKKGTEPQTVLPTMLMIRCRAIPYAVGGHLMNQLISDTPGAVDDLAAGPRRSLEVSLNP